ncbi:sulfatase-like hydrolase/transferase [Nocardioides sp. CCNWLW239]|uniref:sulfatase-like hydrolase/transferase n=1 Tax=Nocardioides sp. CCNWLW239 TaxID=3128902 RepID=UPI00301A9E7E
MPRARLAVAAVAVLAGSSIALGVMPDVGGPLGSLGSLAGNAFARVGNASADGVVPSTPTPTPDWAPYSTRPNILMITADDLAYEDLDYMPHVRSLLAEQGTSMTEAIAPTPICVPARASLLTGQYSHNHETVTVNGERGGYASMDHTGTLPEAMQKAGYDTLFTGKYLNGYGIGKTAKDVPPGWTDWRATTDMSTYNFVQPRINHNGKLTTHHRYTTYVMRDQANQMISAPERAEKPWYMWVNYVAPHHGGPGEKDDPKGISTTRPSDEDKHSFDGLELPDTPNMFRTPTDAPPISPSQTFVDPQRRAELRMAHEQRVEAVQAVDRAVASHLLELRETGQLDNTIVIFSSDNGYTTGGHNINGKLMHYRETQRIPLILRGPRIPAGRSLSTGVGNPDIATTIMAIAGAEPGRPQDGVNFMPWLTAPAQDRVIPLSAWRVSNGHKQIYSGIRFGDWTYARFADGSEELYDMADDPYQVRSLALLPGYADELAELRSLSEKYADCAGDTCPKEFYPAD